MSQLSGRERRLIALAVLVALIALLWLGLVGPIVEGFRSRAEERRTLLQTHSLNARRIARLPEWRRLDREQQRSAAAMAILAPNAALAADQLRERVTRAAAGAGGVAPDSAAGGAAGDNMVVINQVQEVASPPGWVRVRAELTLGLTPLVTLVRQIENGQPHLVVEELNVVADRAFETGRLSPMDVRLEVSAPFTAAPGT